MAQIHYKERQFSGCCCDGIRKDEKRMLISHRDEADGHLGRHVLVVQVVDEHRVGQNPSALGADSAARKASPRPAFE